MLLACGWKSQVPLEVLEPCQVQAVNFQVYPEYKGSLSVSNSFIHFEQGLGAAL